VLRLPGDADLANAAANNEPGRAPTRLELPSHHGGMLAGHMDNDGCVWTNLILLRTGRSGARVAPTAPRLQAGPRPGIPLFFPYPALVGRCR
jgi:hypothetical protein